MSQTQIIIKQKKGQPLQVEVVGVPDSSCRNITEPLETLGQVEVTPKPEMYAEPTITTFSTVEIDS
jgi:hypothetical protein